jgi:hypothetical protein
VTKKSEAMLFNGNIRYMQTRLTNPTTGVAMPMLNAYKYDQLNRLKESRSFENGLSANVWNPVGYNNEYYNSFNFDEMGNIENQIRYSRNGTLIDNLTYHYQKSAGKLVRNRLYHLNDAQTNTAAFSDDIDNMLTFNSTVEEINVFNNYNYDEEGRLVKDSSERISKIVWRVDGKVKEIQRATGDAKWLKFDYDAMGNRIAKHVYNNTGTAHERSTYYVLDAQGNQISTYDHEVVAQNAQFNLKERNIFGSSRIGSKQDSLNVLTATLTQNYTQILGTKYYEFSNHLGNVLTVYSDIKIPLDADANYVVEGFASLYETFQIIRRLVCSWMEGLFRGIFIGMDSNPMNQIARLKVKEIAILQTIVSMIHVWDDGQVGMQKKLNTLWILHIWHLVIVQYL